jgi:23S rRNA pseudouridine2605 synthase
MNSEDEGETSQGSNVHEPSGQLGNPPADPFSATPSMASAEASAASETGGTGAATGASGASGAGRTGAATDAGAALSLEPNQATEPEPSGAAELAAEIRLQKVLAAAGLGSRRACEQLIADGRVSVNGVIVDQLGARVDPNTAEVAVDGRRVSVAPGVVHLALNKPRGVLSAMSDDRGRPTVGDLVRDRPERLFHVGRLDADSEGLLLLTNDGPLAHVLMHPSHGVRKTYLAEVDGSLTRDTVRRLLAGVDLEDGTARADAVKVVQASGRRSLVEIVLHEGRNRIVRRMLAEVGHPVRRLVRTALGSVSLGSQRPGTIRELSVEEVSSLYSLVGQPTHR